MQPRDHFKPSVFPLGSTEVDLELIQMINSNLKKLKGLTGEGIPAYHLHSLSLRTIKKFITISDPRPGQDIRPDEVMEIVDYDPVRDSALTLGGSGQPPDVALHWFIYRALPDVNSIVRMDVELDEARFAEADIVQIDRKLEVLRPDPVMNILPVLKDRKRAFIPGQGLIIYDRSLSDLIENMIECLKTEADDADKGQGPATPEVKG